MEQQAARSRLLITGCYVPETHDPAGGVELSVGETLELLLEPAGEPRDGITVLGGEPFAQPLALTAVLRELEALDIHRTVYTGYTFEALCRRPEPEVREALVLTNLLIDGPYVRRLSAGAGEWRGSRNQRLIALPGLWM
jgi:anaerobic ribonucleoside-triphosphate reductase activating protein